MADERLSIAVIGPGAVGATVAAWLAQDDRFAVTVAARTPFHRLRVEAPDGVVVEAVPAILTDPAEARPADWVLIATKTYDAPGTKAWLRGFVAPSTRVAVLQNGVEHVARFADAVPAGRIVPVVVDIPAERLAPGHVRQRKAGTMLVPEGPAGEAFSALFAHAPIDAATTGDFLSAAWTKLALNCAGIVNALTLKPAGVAARPDIANIMGALVRECVAVGRAEGARLEDDLPDRVVANYRAAAPDSVNSLHADFAAGRPMEVDARNGVIVEIGRRHGIAAPVNAMLAALLRAAAAR